MAKPENNRENYNLAVDIGGGWHGKSGVSTLPTKLFSLSKNAIAEASYSVNSETPLVPYTLSKLGHKQLQLQGLKCMHHCISF